MINDGSTTPAVLTIPPNMPNILFPTNVAVFSEIGPGVTAAIPTILAKVELSIQLCLYIISFSIIGIIT